MVVRVYFFLIVECWSYSTSDLRRTNQAARRPSLKAFTCASSRDREARLIVEMYCFVLILHLLSISQ